MDNKEQRVEETQILPFKEALIWGVEKKIGERIIKVPTLGLGDAIGGLRPDDFVVITARGGTGKTWLMLQIAYDLATKGEDQGGQVPCGFLSGEMSVEDLADSRLMRMHPKTRNIPLDGLPSDKLETIMKIDDIPYYLPVIEERWPFSTRCVPVMDRMREEFGVKAFFLDHMKYFLNADPLQVRSDERLIIEQTVLDMRLYAKKHKTPIFLAVQPKQISADDEVTSDSLKGTSAIGQDATVTLVLDRPRLKKKKGDDRDTRKQVYTEYVKLKVEKARHGPGNTAQKLVLDINQGRLVPYIEPETGVLKEVKSYKN